MKKLTKSFGAIIFVLVLIIPIQSMAGSISNTPSPLLFRIGPRFGDRQIFAINIIAPGCITAWISPWRSTGSDPIARELALILNGPGQSGYYDREDSTATATPIVSYTIDKNHLGQ